MAVIATQKISSTNIHTAKVKNDKSLYRPTAIKTTLLTATVA